MNRIAIFILGALLAAGAMALAPAGQARADMIPTQDIQFSLISGGSSFADQVHINVKVSQVATDQIRLDFQNLSGTTATVGQIYLHGGNSIGFDTAFAFGADKPSPKNGLQAGDSFQMLVDLRPGVVAAEFMDGLSTKAVRIGLHVQALDDGGSLSLASTPPGGGGAVPEPGTMALLGSALAGGLGWSWRRKRQEAAGSSES
jgi:hypothetical protein